VPSNQGSFAVVRTGELALERNDAGSAVLTISGEHDLSTAPNLRRRLDGLLDGLLGGLLDGFLGGFLGSSFGAFGIGPAVRHWRLTLTVATVDRRPESVR